MCYSHRTLYLPQKEHYMKNLALIYLILTLCSCATSPKVGVGAKPIKDAEVIFDGSEKMMHEKWTYWQGPGFASSLPVKWKIVPNPVGEGTVMLTHDPVTTKGKYGSSDLVTKKKYKDFRLHIEFLVANKGGNSGVYLQNRYEIQIKDGDKTKHGMGAVINETKSPYEHYKGMNKWNSYDIVFKAARFKDGKLSENPIVTVYFNGQKVHTDQVINKVWGGPKSGLDGGNDKGFGITDRPGGLKLQNEGHKIHYRNIWIKELNLDGKKTDF